MMEHLKNIIREKFEGLFDNSLDPILVHDNKGMIIDVNKILLDTFQLSREQLLGKSVKSILRKEDLYQAINTKKELVNYGKVSKLSNYMVQLPNIPPRYFEVYSIPFRMDGKIIAIINISHNITEKIKTEKKVEKNRTKYKIAFERQNLYKDVFTHDTQNLLQVLLSSVELCQINLSMNNFPKKIEELLNFCKLQILRGAYIVNTINLFSDLARAQRQLSEIDVLFYLYKALKNIKAYSHRKSANITVKYESQYRHVKADKYLVDAFENILLNAIHNYLNPEVEIEIIIKNVKDQDAEFIQMEFIDNGPGIPDLRKNVIYRNNEEEVEDSNERRTGLGFHLIKEIIKPYEAQFWVENRVPGDYSKGSKFILSFHQKFNLL